jgi:RNA polymerase sigma-70 factor (ECF subfamily)
MTEAAGETFERLMSLYQQADRDAATQLITRLSPQIFGFYVSQVNDRPRAEDLLQEFWLRIHKARHTYRPGEPVLPWAFSIARRVLVDFYRKNKRIREHELQAEHLPELPDPTKNEPLLPEMHKLLQTLPASQREVVTLLKVDGLTLEEVATLTGSTVGAVKQRAFRAYESLRKLFGSES